MVETLKILISVPGLIFLLLIAGAILVSATAAHTRAGKIMVGLALVLFIGLGNGPAAYRILETLEKQYPPLTSADLPAGPAKIVVLTGTGKISSGRAVSAMVDSSSLYRLVEAAALFNLDPESEIVVSGNRECVEAMRAVLTAVGVPATKNHRRNPIGQHHGKRRQCRQACGRSSTPDPCDLRQPHAARRCRLQKSRNGPHPGPDRLPGAG